MLLTEAEKEYLRDQIYQACRGTPLNSNAEFAGGYLGNLVVSFIENWDTIREELKKAPEGPCNSH